jgi:hypothetical protein
MGLYVSHLDSVTIKDKRSLYVYLLDYGWPDGQWEQLFKRHFMQMADRAAETGAVVIASPRGVHFANDVLSWHRIGDLDGSAILPALLITKTPPHYFKECHNEEPAAEGLEDLLVVPLRPICRDETDFLRIMEGVFSDLKEGRELRNFQAAEHDARSSLQRLGTRLVQAIELKPGAFGVSIDLKTFFQT